MTRQPKAITNLLAKVLAYGPAAMEKAAERERVYYAGLKASTAWEWDKIPTGGMTWDEYWQLPENIKKMELITREFNLTADQVKEAIYSRFEHLYVAMHCD